MPDRSDTTSGRDKGFIGFRCDPEKKRAAKHRAQKEGTSISELMRQRLDDLTDSAGKAPATT
jgi:predicted HicB family RNase H-like nuclease